MKNTLIIFFLFIFTQSNGQTTLLQQYNNGLDSVNTSITTATKLIERTVVGTRYNDLWNFTLNVYDSLLLSTVGVTGQRLADSTDSIRTWVLGNFYPLLSNPTGYLTSSNLNPYKQKNDSIAPTGYWTVYRGDTSDLNLWNNFINFYTKTQSDGRYLQSFTETDPIATAKTETITNGYGMLGGGSGQTIGSNPSWVLKPDSTLFVAFTDTLKSKGILTRSQLLSYGYSTTTGTVISVTSSNGDATITPSSPNPIVTINSAPKWDNSRNIAGNSVDGSANVAFSNKFIVQGTTDVGLSGSQFLGALATGLVKNTTSTGVLSIATISDIPTGYPYANLSGTPSTFPTSSNLETVTTNGNSTDQGIQVYSMSATPSTPTSGNTIYSPSDNTFRLLNHNGYYIGLNGTSNTGNRIYTAADHNFTLDNINTSSTSNLSKYVESNGTNITSSATIPFTDLTGLPILQALWATPIKRNVNYIANQWEFVRFVDTSANDTLFLPNAPNDSTICGFKLVKLSGGYNTVVKCQGTDSFNISGNTNFATYSIPNQAATYLYKKAEKIWVVISTDFPLSGFSGDFTVTPAGVATIKTSVSLAGNPTTTTQTNLTNNTTIATTAYADIYNGHDSSVTFVASLTPYSIVANRGYTINYEITAATGAITVNNQSRAWQNNQILIIQYKDNGTPMAISYGTHYKSSVSPTTITAATTTVASQVITQEWIYNSSNSEFFLVGQVYTAY